MSSPAALVYETTEEARVLLLEAGDSRLAEARSAAGEAAYYLSDTIEPEDRASLLSMAARRQQAARAASSDVVRAGEALSLLSDAAGEVEDLLRGPSASSELRIALRALRRAITALASHAGLARQRGAQGLRTGPVRLLRRAR